LNAIPAILTVALIVPVGLRLGLPYAVFVLCSLLPPLIVGGLLSMGRFTATLFPIFMWLAIRGRESTTAWAVGFALFQALAAVLFYTWRPLF
jgi:hypothetical protein